MAAPVRDFLADADGHMAIVNGDFALVAGAEAVPQGVAIRLRMFLGEVWLDESIGVDWINKVFVKNPDPLLIREILRRRIASTPDVTNVVGAQVNISSRRKGSVSYQIKDIYGTQSKIGEVVVP